MSIGIRSRSGVTAVLALVALGLTTTGVAPAASAAEAGPYPQRPVTLVVPFPPGGVGDGSARIAAQQIAERLGQPIVIENRTGASGTIGAQFVARAKADGYTLLYGSSGPMVGNLFLLKDAGYHPLKTFVPVFGLTSTPMVLVAPAGKGVQDFAGLLERARERPGALNFGHHGVGTGAQLGGVLLEEVTGIRWNSVSYRGEGPTLTDLVGGSLDVAFAYPTSVAQYVGAGRLVALATTSPVRLPHLPEVPTVKELGFAELTFSPWNGLFAPAGTPPEIVARIAEAAAATLQHASVKEWMPRAGALPLDLGPAEFARFIEAEIPRFKRLVERSGATAQ